MIVVSNTSPIINMAVVKQLDLLRRLYEKVIIPQAVYHEITAGGAGGFGGIDIQSLEWIETREVKDQPLAVTLQTEVDRGEAEAIALAVQIEADILLLDERRGRAIASRLGFHFIGLLGVLVEAKHKKYIPKVKPLLDELMVQAGFWVSDRLYNRVLQASGE